MYRCTLGSGIPRKLGRYSSLMASGILLLLLLLIIIIVIIIIITFKHQGSQSTIKHKGFINQSDLPSQKLKKSRKTHLKLDVSPRFFRVFPCFFWGVCYVSREVAPIPIPSLSRRRPGSWLSQLVSSNAVSTRRYGKWYRTRWDPILVGWGVGRWGGGEFRGGMSFL